MAHGRMLYSHEKGWISSLYSNMQWTPNFIQWEKPASCGTVYMYKMLLCVCTPMCLDLKGPHICFIHREIHKHLGWYTEADKYLFASGRELSSWGAGLGRRHPICISKCLSTHGYVVLSASCRVANWYLFRAKFLG